MKIRLILILIFGINVLNGQVVTLPDELYGFRLGQYKSVVINELGQPSRSKILDDSSSVDFYLFQTIAQHM